MDWNKGFSAVYYASLVDRATWRDTDKFEITGGSVTRSDSSLIESADVSTRYQFEGEKWIRVYMDTRQDGAAGHVALFTGLAVPPQTDIKGNVISYSLECYSVLKPAEDVLLDRGFYVAESANSGDVLMQLLKVTPAPVEVAREFTPRLKTTIIAEEGETHLSMVYKVLKAIGWRIRLTGDGRIIICPKANKASVTYDALDNDAVEPQITMNHDWFACPNVFRAIADDMMAIARDDRPESALSTVSRGREVWMEETGCTLNLGEGIAEYALRRLKEEQAKAYDCSYRRRFHPDVTVSDLVALHYPKQGLNGNYKVTEQRIELGSGCRMEEQVEYC